MQNFRFPALLLTYALGVVFVGCQASRLSPVHADGAQFDSTPGRNVLGGPDADRDRDSVVNREDNCPLDFNLDQTDTDGDGIGDACELHERVAGQ